MIAVIGRNGILVWDCIGLYDLIEHKAIWKEGKRISFSAKNFCGRISDLITLTESANTYKRIYP